MEIYSLICKGEHYITKSRYTSELWHARFLLVLIWRSWLFLAHCRQASLTVRRKIVNIFDKECYNHCLKRVWFRGQYFMHTGRRREGFQWVETPTTSVGEAEAGQPLRDLPATGEAGVEVAAGAATDPTLYLAKSRHIGAIKNLTG